MRPTGVIYILFVLLLAVPILVAAKPPLEKLGQEDLVLVGRLVRGIQKWKTWKNGPTAPWLECGKVHEDGPHRAMIWAYHITKASKRKNINTWGLAGTIANESGFDQCSLGKWPRKWGYKNKYLKKPKRHVSHTKEDIVKMLSTSKAQAHWRRTGVDIGPCQILSKYYIGDYKDMMSIDPGIEICATEMQSRGKMHKTKRPWLYWPGHKAEWYNRKIVINAKIMGAKPGEI